MKAETLYSAFATLKASNEINKLIRTIQGITAVYGIRPENILDAVQDVIGLTKTKQQSIPKSVYELDNSYGILIDIPGVKKDSIDISIEGDTLIVKASRNKSTDNLIYDNRTYDYETNILIGELADKDSIKASYTDGVLSIQLDKKQPKKKIVVD